jgi:hypothetical protein
MILLYIYIYIYACFSVSSQKNQEMETAEFGEVSRRNLTVMSQYLEKVSDCGPLSPPIDFSTRIDCSVLNGLNICYSLVLHLI